MVSRVIREAIAADCWRTFTRQFWNYWGRLSAAGSDCGLIAVAPSLSFDPSEHAAELVLGGDAARSHEPMATSDQVKALFARSHHNSVLLGRPPSALVLGIQKLMVDQDQDGKFVLRTTSYKYCLLARNASGSLADAPAWFAMRLESDSRIGWNSWLLNHPIHHIQFGFCEDLRILSPRGRSLASFVDAALRHFIPEVWGEMYPSLFLHLTEPTGRFKPFAQRISGPEIELNKSHTEDLRAVLREGRADGLDWYRELDQWREDVDAHSVCAPEMYDFFADDP